MASSAVHFCSNQLSRSTLSQFTHPNFNYLPLNSATVTASTYHIIKSHLSYKSSSSKICSSVMKPFPLKKCNIFVITNNHVENSPVSSSSSSLLSEIKIGIIGFGNFGQFLAKAFKRQGHSVLATSRSDYSNYCRDHGIEFFRDIDGLCEAQPDLILLCSSIVSTENVVRGIPFHKLNPDTIFADVLSVKQFPRNLFLEVLPEEFGILCTHPMFGPNSGEKSWDGLRFVYDKVRIAESSIQDHICSQFLSIFQNEGCRMVEMLCEEHDRYAAGSQFITHTIGRILSQLELDSTPINTKGYEALLELTENTVSDSFDLYYGLFMYNVNATEQIENMDRAFETVKQKLFGRLHEILRKQIVDRGSSSSSSMETNPIIKDHHENQASSPSYLIPSATERIIRPF